jgi:hypothetical protein
VITENSFCFAVGVVAAIAAGWWYFPSRESEIDQVSGSRLLLGFITSAILAVTWFYVQVTTLLEIRAENLLRVPDIK